MNHRLVIEGEVVRSSGTGRRSYSIIADGVKVFLPWKLFTYLYKFANALIEDGLLARTHKCDLEPARPENATGYIYNLKRLLRAAGIYTPLIENWRDGYYGIIPSWDVSITTKAKKLIEEG